MLWSGAGGAAVCCGGVGGITGALSSARIPVTSILSNMPKLTLNLKL